MTGKIIDKWGHSNVFHIYLDLQKGHPQIQWNIHKSLMAGVRVKLLVNMNMLLVDVQFISQIHHNAWCCTGKRHININIIMVVIINIQISVKKKSSPVTTIVDDGRNRLCCNLDNLGYMQWYAYCIKSRFKWEKNIKKIDPMLALCPQSHLTDLPVTLSDPIDPSRQELPVLVDSFLRRGHDAGISQHWVTGNKDLYVYYVYHI